MIVKLGEGIGEAWENGMGLDIGPEPQEDTVTIVLDRLMLEHEGKIGTLRG